MTELLYNKSKAVAALNKVEGFKEIGELNQMTEDQCKWMYYGAIRKIRRKMGGEK